MNQRILIIGPASSLCSELITLYRQRGWVVAAALDPDEDTLPAGEEGKHEDETGEKQIHRFSWNRRSPLSARSLILECKNVFGGIERAIVVHAPDRVNQAFHEVPAGYIESKVDSGIKGYLFLLKELVGFFQKQGSGSIALVMHDEGSEVLSPVDACVSGSFKALAQSLFMFYQNEPINLIGFRSSTTQVHDFAGFIFRNSEEKSVKSSSQWLKFSEKSGFFQSLPRGIMKK